MTERYDNLVIGGGMAGLPLALRAARDGRTAFVEKEKLGETRLNRGCIPTKTMIASAAVAHQVRRAAEFGVHTTTPSVHLGEVVDRKDQIVADIRAGSYRAVDKADGLDLIEAEGRFMGRRRLQIGPRRRHDRSRPDLPGHRHSHCCPPGGGTRPGALPDLPHPAGPP